MKKKILNENVTNFIDNISVKALGLTTIMCGGKTFLSLLSGLAVSFGHVVLKLSRVAMRMRKNVNDQTRQILAKTAQRQGRR